MRASMSPHRPLAYGPTRLSWRLTRGPPGQGTVARAGRADGIRPDALLHPVPTPRAGSRRVSEVFGQQTGHSPACVRIVQGGGGGGFPKQWLPPGHVRVDHHGHVVRQIPRRRPDQEVHGAVVQHSAGPRDVPLGEVVGGDGERDRTLLARGQLDAGERGVTGLGFRGGKSSRCSASSLAALCKCVLTSVEDGTDEECSTGACLIR